MFYKRFFKRAIDLAVATLAFILLLPVLTIVTLLLTAANGGTPFFFQSRPGKKGRIFRVIKFKTMNDRRDTDGRLLPDSERLTPVGALVRRTSLDEIPQLLNVIKGDMSLVGPRPLLVDYLPRYTERQLGRHEVRPGITGWAQVNGRNAISWEQKFEYDLWYVKHCSLALDIRIIGMTIQKVFKSEGISQQGHATMPYFEGTKHS